MRFLSGLFGTLHGGQVAVDEVRLRASDASDPEEPLFAIQHSGNRRVARNSVFPSFAMWLVN